MKNQEKSKLQTAVKLYEDRQSRAAHPSGHTDNGGRWYPSETEHCDCCDGIRGPSRAYPWSYMVHCRTAEHVGNLYGVSGAEIRKIVAAKKSEERRIENSTPKTFFKAVAYAHGRLFSIFDGSEYVLEQPRKQHATSKHTGFFVHTTPTEAMEAAVPDSSIFLELPRVILECECTGPYGRYGTEKNAWNVLFGRSEKISVTTITPKKIVLGLAPLFV